MLELDKHIISNVTDPYILSQIKDLLQCKIDMLTILLKDRKVVQDTLEDPQWEFHNLLDYI